MEERSPQEIVFRHEAMAADFALRVFHPDPVYAGHAAAEAFAELDALEQKLSRFVEGSDIFRLNRLRKGERSVISVEMFECLHIALGIQRATQGAYDATFRSPEGTPPEPRIELFPEEISACALVDGLEIDLGGIGKGYALDRMALVLRDWDVHRALLLASSSTLLGLDPPPGTDGWRARVGPDNDSHLIFLRNEALSASGKAVRGEHIFDPFSREPVTAHVRVWSRARTATEADALSTAFMVMSQQEVMEFCRQNPSTEAFLLPKESAPMVCSSRPS